jgi:hypothetical protein
MLKQIKEMTSLAEAELDRVLEFYNLHGINPGFRPRIKYVERKSLAYAHGNLIAMVNTDEKTWEELIARINRVNSRRWYRHFQLEIGEKALDEIQEKTQRGLLNVNHQLLSQDADIIVFLPLSETGLGEILAHEVWHLIEDRRGVKFTDSYLHEATASYAQTLFAGRSFDLPEITGPQDMIYKYGSYLLHRQAMSVSNSLVDFLDPLKRARLEKLFQEEFIPALEQEILKYSEDIDQTKLSIGAGILDDPNFHYFREDPSTEALLQDFRERGLGELANDLEKQDLNRFVGFLRTSLRNAPKIRRFLEQQQANLLQAFSLALMPGLGEGQLLTRGDLESGTRRVLIFIKRELELIGGGFKALLASGELKEYRAEELDEDEVYFIYPEDLAMEKR